MVQEQLFIYCKALRQQTILVVCNLYLGDIYQNRSWVLPSLLRIMSISGRLGEDWNALVSWTYCSGVIAGAFVFGGIPHAAGKDAIPAPR